MKVYQTIHKYAPHIPLFEKRHGLQDAGDISFSALQDLLIKDGYASAYILEPALKGKTDEVFFTIWDYERLQLAWAKEHGIDSRDLNVIKKAQIDWFQPDVFYNHSAFCDDDFLARFPVDTNITTVCWYGIIGETPEPFPDYNIRLSLHQPFIKSWLDQGRYAVEMQPSFCNQWTQYDTKEKETDFLFYGQTGPVFFKQRNRMLEELTSLMEDYSIRLHLTFPKIRPVFNLPLIRDYFRFGFISSALNKKALSPLYGEDLYSAIGKSKFTLNGYTDYNKAYKSNMRLFEALGCGSLLISENGNYPEGFEEGKHYIGYNDNDDLLRKLPDIIAQYDSLYAEMQPHIEAVKARYSKANQWQFFQKIVAEYRSEHG